MKILLVLLTFIATTSIHALELDEKLTTRFLKVSNSKKTVLINRGAEDGLVVGDHAKFFITSGVIARGVVEKVSPSRSIWSLYRVVDPAEITDGKVLNLKISSPVKITADPTKSMKEEEIPGGSDTMSMSDGDAEDAADKSAGAASTNSDEEQKELEGLGLEDTEVPAKKAETKPSKKEKKQKVISKEVSVVEETVDYATSTAKNWEVWGTLSVNALTGTVDNPNTPDSSTASTASAVDFALGIEKYFLTSDSFLKNTSLTVFIHKRSLESGEALKVTTDWFEYGGGASYHFYNSAAAVNRLIGFGAVNFGMGSGTFKEEANGTGDPVKGSNTFFSVGMGGKYILNNGFGLRAVLDYYSSSESFDFGDVTTKRTLAGPRVLFGLSYRF